MNPRVRSIGIRPPPTPPEARGPSRTAGPRSALRRDSSARRRAPSLIASSQGESFEALNAHLERRCLARMDAGLRGHSESIGQRMERDLEALLPLPEAPYDACEKQAGRVSSLSLVVRYGTNDYSAPVAYGYRNVLVRGYVDQVVISCGSEVIARHPRSYQRDDFVYDPIHYLPSSDPEAAARFADVLRTAS